MEVIHALRDWWTQISWHCFVVRETARKLLQFSGKKTWAPAPVPPPIPTRVKFNDQEQCILLYIIPSQTCILSIPLSTLHILTPRKRNHKNKNWLVISTHWENMVVKMVFIFPNFRGETLKKYLSCHAPILTKKNCLWKSPDLTRIHQAISR